MFKYNNTHIFTGYLKQYLSSFNLPACRIYTNEFAEYLDKYGTEDPRVLESFDTIRTITQTPAGPDITVHHMAVRINYLKNDVPYIYYCTEPSTNRKASWKNNADMYYSSDKTVLGLTRTLNSYGNQYDTITHEYLGDYLRFIRDYHNINLMSMYNCFNNKICNNIYYKHEIKHVNPNFNPDIAENSVTNPRYVGSTYSTFNSQDATYRIYAIPVKLFAKYTVAIDCNQGVEMFCGLYSTTLEVSDAAKDLATKTYMKVNKTLFKQPFIYDKLTIEQWPVVPDFRVSTESIADNVATNAKPSKYTHWDIANREKDLKLFIKVPTSCNSSITILEGDFVGFNDCSYVPTRVEYTNSDGTVGTRTAWKYSQNNSVLNFNTKDKINLNNYEFKPISKLQLLAFNTGESYPFADRLVEYLGGSAITPIDEITDNIKRAQRVMEYNNNYFAIEGLWEPKMQNIIYDYLIHSGPIEVKDGVLRDRHSGLNPKNYGYHPRLGHTNKSTLYDVLGYVDKDAEKWYSCWKNENGVAVVKDNIQNVDIYNGLYDIK